MSYVLLLVLLFILLLPIKTQVLYMAIMMLDHAKEAGRLPPFTEKYVAKPLLVYGLFCDFLTNLTWGTVLFLERPKEWLLSPRVARLQDMSHGYRKTVAAWVCHNLLDPFDKSGCHCKPSLYD